MPRTTQPPKQESETPVPLRDRIREAVEAETVLHEDGSTTVFVRVFETAPHTSLPKAFYKRRLPFRAPSPRSNRSSDATIDLRGEPSA